MLNSFLFFARKSADCVLIFLAICGIINYGLVYSDMLYFVRSRTTDDIQLLLLMRLYAYLICKRKMVKIC